MLQNKSALFYTSAPSKVKHHSAVQTMGTAECSKSVTERLSEVGVTLRCIKDERTSFHYFKSSVRSYLKLVTKFCTGFLMAEILIRNLQ